MYCREKNIQDQLDKRGIVLASLKSTDRKCIVCWETSLRILGEGYDSRTQ